MIVTIANKNMTIQNNYLKRDWKNYTPDLLVQNMTNNLFGMSPYYDTMNVQEQWNELEHLMISSVDQTAPLSSMGTRRVVKPGLVDHVIRPKLNKRNRLLRCSRINNYVAHANEIKKLNRDIRIHFAAKSRCRIRRTATSGKGNTGLWNAVKLAKNLNSNVIPKNMTLDGVAVASSDLVNAFAGHFNVKVKHGVDSAVIDLAVYNGRCHLIVQNRCFMRS